MGAGKGSFWYHRGILICATIIGKYLGRQCKHFKISLPQACISISIYSRAFVIWNILTALWRYCDANGIVFVVYVIPYVLLSCPEKQATVYLKCTHCDMASKHHLNNNRCACIKWRLLLGKLHGLKQQFEYKCEWSYLIGPVLRCIWRHIKVANTIRIHENWQQ